MKIIYTVMVCLFFGSLVLADMTVVQTLKSDLMPGAKHDSTMTMTVKGQKARIDLPGSKMSSIIDAKAGKIYTLIHNKKQVMVLSLEDLKKSAALATKSKEGKTKPAFHASGRSACGGKKTGKTKTIQGYKCTEYDFLGVGANPAKIKCWIAEDVDDSEMEVVRSFGGKMGGMFGFNDVQKPKGMVIRSESKMNINGREVISESEVQSIKRDPVDDSLFVLPSDYNILELPAFNPQAKPPAAK